MKHLWLVVLLAACPPTEPLCQPVSSGRPAPTSLLLMDGVPQTFSFVLDGPACQLPEGALSARPILTGPSGEPIAVGVERLEQNFDPSVFENTIGFDLVFPALTRGTYFLQLFVEPTITAIQLPVFVATDRSGRVGTPLSFDAPCPLPARTRNGTMFCGFDGGFVARRDSSPITFPRVRRVIAVGNVAWMLDADAQLRRYEDRPDGGLVLTATGGAARGLVVADEDAAVLGELDFNTAFARFDYDAASGALSRRSLPVYAEDWFLEGSQVIGVSQRGLCTGLETCSASRPDDTGLLGYDAQFLWLFDNRPGTASPGVFGNSDAPTRMVLLRRPVRLDGGEAFTTPIPAGWAPAGKAARLEVGGELPPLLYSLPDAGVRRTMLVRQTPEGTSFDVLPADPVGFSRDWLIFAGSTSRELRIVPLPLSP